MAARKVTKASSASGRGLREGDSVAALAEEEKARIKRLKDQNKKLKSLNRALKAELGKAKRKRSG